MAITVRSGDTLSGIAQRHGVSLNDLVRANPQVQNPNLIYPGQELNLPGWNGQSGVDEPKAQQMDLGGGTYTVQSGDTLSAIGNKFGVSFQALASLNGIANPNLIFAGQVLHVPRGAGTVPTAPAQAPASGNGHYTVEPGDTLSKIGGQFGVPWQNIARENGIASPYRIYPGQSLSIPGVDPGKVTGPGPVAQVPGSTTGGVSVEQLRAIMPNLSAGRANQLLPYLNDAMVKGGINTPARQAAFLAQLAHESVGLTAFEEYASGAAYEGRTDLGNTQPGDGVRFKGRGPIQLTGRSNYRAAGQALGLDLEGNPSRAADIDVGFRTAVWFWNSRNLNFYADNGNFDAITYRVNGGYNGKAARDAYYARAKQVLGA
ncbi:MAG TPA: LysM peptidoglycan-binding domain-containing protein [Myxococcales bacterium]|jgi:putative chitinase